MRSIEKLLILKKAGLGKESLLKIVLRNLLGLDDWSCSGRKVSNDIRKRCTFIIYFANVSLYTDYQYSTHKCTNNLLIISCIIIFLHFETC